VTCQLSRVFILIRREERKSAGEKERKKERKSQGKRVVQCSAVQARKDGMWKAGPFRYNGMYTIR